MKHEPDQLPQSDGVFIGWEKEFERVCEKDVRQPGECS
jgi:hypothetical protein